MRDILGVPRLIHREGISDVQERIGTNRNEETLQWTSNLSQVFQIFGNSDTFLERHQGLNVQLFLEDLLKARISFLIFEKSLSSLISHHVCFLDCRLALFVRLILLKVQSRQLTTKFPIRVRPGRTWCPLCCTQQTHDGVLLGPGNPDLLILLSCCSEKIWAG